MTIVFQGEIEKKMLMPNFWGWSKKECFSILCIFRNGDWYVTNDCNTRDYLSIIINIIIVIIIMNKPVSYEHIYFHHYTDCARVVKFDIIAVNQSNSH